MACLKLSMRHFFQGKEWVTPLGDRKSKKENLKNLMGREPGWGAPGSENESSQK